MLSTFFHVSRFLDGISGGLPVEPCGQNGSGFLNSICAELGRRLPRDWKQCWLRCQDLTSAKKTQTSNNAPREDSFQRRSVQNHNQQPSAVRGEGRRREKKKRGLFSVQQRNAGERSPRVRRPLAHTVANTIIPQSPASDTFNVVRNSFSSTSISTNLFLIK